MRASRSRSSRYPESVPEDTVGARLKVVRRRLHRHPGYIEYMNHLALEQAIAAVFAPNLRELLVLLEPRH
jgi:hypothetical protein